MSFSLILQVLLIFAVSPLSGAMAQDAFYERKTVEILVPFGTGGGTDTVARFLAPHLQRDLGNNVRVQVVNKPGGGGVAGSNEFALRRKPDGLTLFISSVTPTFAYLLGEPEVRFDFRDFEPILGFPFNGVVYVRSDLGIESAEELVESSEEIIYGGISATGVELLSLLAFDILKVDARVIFGYEGSGPARLAIERGETNANYDTVTAYLSNVEPLVQEGQIVPLFTFGWIGPDGEVVRDPLLPDLPNVREVYMDAYGEEPSGNAWEVFKGLLGALGSEKTLWVHKDAPVEARQELRAAASRMIADADFTAAAATSLGGYSFIPGEQAEKTFFSGLDNISDEKIAWVYDFLREEYEIER
jgi:tripartite-type tricarboxylate transporter receptor subunit TctC